MPLPKILLFDLDETIVFSEEMKTKAWSDILKAFGYCWEEENVGNLTSVPKDKRPKTGLSPHDFIEKLIVDLKLASLSPYQDKREEMIKTLKDQWTSSLIAQAKLFAKEGRIREVPGAVEEIKRARQKGYRIGVITQAPVEYANKVLISLGLLDRDNEENHIVDVVVSGDMVKNPKPNPELLILATDLIFQKMAVETTEEELGRKLSSTQKIEIKNAIHQEYFGPIETVFPNPYAVVGDSFTDIESARRYPGIGKIRTILINSRNLSLAEIKEIRPDFTINRFEDLLPQLEGNVSRKEAKR